MKRPQDVAVSTGDMSRWHYQPPTPSELEIETSKSIALANERVLAAVRAKPRGGQREAPPPSNTGGKYPDGQLGKLVSDEGVVKEIPLRRGFGGSAAFVDWLNFTCHESSFMRAGSLVTDTQVIDACSETCMEIFGFGITARRETGLNFYKTSFVLGDKFGFVCHGGQRDTVLIVLSGEGCMAAREGWELRLKNFLEGEGEYKQGGAVCARITRIDLSYDDFNGEFVSVDLLEAQYDQGAFNCGGRNPDIEMRGNWKNPNGKGRTLYVGNRTNGKFFRGYEKGKQLGSPSSNWVRLEVEFKSVDRFIPLDALTRPGEYLAAAYPALSWISERQERILTIQKTVEASYERTTRWLKNQCGAAINCMLQVEQSAEKVLALIIREGKTPRGLTVPDYRFAGEPIHLQQREQLPFEVAAGLAFSLT